MSIRRLRRGNTLASYPGRAIQSVLHPHGTSVGAPAAEGVVGHGRRHPTSSQLPPSGLPPPPAVEEARTTLTPAPCRRAAEEFESQAMCALGRDLVAEAGGQEWGRGSCSRSRGRGRRGASARGAQRLRCGDCAEAPGGAPTMAQVTPMVACTASTPNSPSMTTVRAVATAQVSQPVRRNSRYEHHPQLAVASGSPLIAGRAIRPSVTHGPVKRTA